MERSGYEYRRKKPFLDLPSEHRKTREFVSEPRLQYQAPHSYKIYNPQEPKLFEASEKSLDKKKFKGFTTPIQNYKSPQTPKTPKIDTRYASYDTPRPYMKSAIIDESADNALRYERYKKPESLSSAVSWQYNIPPQSECFGEDYERPMDPREFKEQCRRAFEEANEERKRNAEMSVWGKCKWATYDRHRGAHSQRR